VRHTTSTAVTKAAYSPGEGSVSPIWAIFVCQVANSRDNLLPYVLSVVVQLPNASLS
jgi:hypothetical protein